VADLFFFSDTIEHYLPVYFAYSVIIDKYCMFLSVFMLQILSRTPIWLEDKVCGPQ